MTRLRLVIAVAAGLLLTGGAAFAALQPSDAPRREGVTLQGDARARAGGQQVLGGTREPGVPSVQRMRHDDVDFTVTVAPARPGPNLVRIDVSYWATRTGSTVSCPSSSAPPVRTPRTPSCAPGRAPARAACGPSSTCRRARAPCS